MHVVHGYEHVPADVRGAALAIGNFDGVHRGHQALLARVKERARTEADHGGRKLAGALLFEPHPRELFAPDRTYFRLTTLEQKLELLEAFGVDLAVVLAFDRALASLTAAEFIERVLVAGLGVRHIVIGYDFFFGKGRGGSAALMSKAGAEMGFGVSIVDPVGEDGEVFSSSAIRSALAMGDVRAAAEALGHWWRIAGVVTGGYKRGTGLGYPTANIKLPRGTALGHGIYAVRVHIDGTCHAGAAYLGTRPTFDNGQAVLETFLFDFDDNIYGRTISIEFIAHLRGDRRFESAEALKAQMDKDCAAARDVLARVAAKDPLAGLPLAGRPCRLSARP